MYNFTNLTITETTKHHDGETISLKEYVSKLS